ncbi:MAG: nucleotidyltransferase domain-containing protein [Clostridiales bacterium]|nr:nucleotidyltransferase domain-containing protein [Clostridiales bacterium]
MDRILLFGSHARGDAGPGSDIDLLVTSPDFGRDVLRDMVLLRECLPDRTVDIDTIARTPEQVASAEPDSFLATILKDAVTGTVPQPIDKYPNGIPSGCFLLHPPAPAEACNLRCPQA